MTDLPRPAQALVEEFCTAYAEVLEVNVTELGVDPLIVGATLQPTAPGALTVSLCELVGDGDFILQAGHEGGSWELSGDPVDVAFARAVIQAVADGRVVEVFGPDRSRVEVTMADGSVAGQTGYGPAGLRGCLPVPGWKRAGRRVAYSPWR